MTQSPNLVHSFFSLITCLKFFKFIPNFCGVTNLYEKHEAVLGKIIVFLVHIFRMLQNFQQEYYDPLKFKFALTFKCVIKLKQYITNFFF